MTNVTVIGQPNKVFTLDEANELIPLLAKITTKSEAAVQRYIEQQSFCVKSGATDGRVKDYDKKIGEQLVQWGTKVTKLGARALDSGYVAFDSGNFFWSWHLGDTSITHYHYYRESPHMRRPLSSISDWRRHDPPTIK